MADIPRHENVAIAGAHRLIDEEDEAQLKLLDPRDVQTWCDSWIAEYESRIYTLRSARNVAALIHQFLPPELLLDIFENLFPTPTRRRHGLPVLRICRRWRMLVLDTPQFCVNLIGQPLEATRVPQLELARLNFAIARSATLEFALSWRGCGSAIVDLFLPFIHRISSSFTAMFSNQDDTHASRFMEAGHPFLEQLSLSHSYHWLGSDHPLSVSPIAVRVSQFPRLQALHIVRSPLLIFTTQSLLRELDLLQTSVRDPNDPDNTCHGIGPILDVLGFTKRLETLRISPGGYPGDISESLGIEADRQLPFLRTVVVRDDPRSVRIFLAYVEFPSTTRLEVSRSRPCV